MNRFWAILLILTMLSCFAGCDIVPAPEDVVNDKILDKSVEELREDLIGKSRKELIEMFGEPEAVLEGVRGDIFVIHFSEKLLVVYYDEDGLVNRLKIEPRK